MRVLRRDRCGETTCCPTCAPVSGMHFINADGEALFRFDVAGARLASFMFYQPELERALRAGVDRLPSVDVHLGHEVVGFEQHADHVEVTVRDLGTGRSRVLRARYLLGSDGARSLVRKQLGIGSRTCGFDQPWLVVDTLLTPARRAARHRAADLRSGPAHHLRPDVRADGGAGSSCCCRARRAQDMEARRVSPSCSRPGWNRTTSRSCGPSCTRSTRSWPSSGATVASSSLGDAAHQMPPFLGQGMCSGIRDAANLAWKLDLVLRGLAPDGLLDTYQEERAPHVRSDHRDRRRPGRLAADDRSSGRGGPGCGHARAGRRAARPERHRWADRRGPRRGRRRPGGRRWAGIRAAGARPAGTSRRARIVVGCRRRPHLRPVRHHLRRARPTRRLLLRRSRRPGRPPRRAPRRPDARAG